MKKITILLVMLSLAFNVVSAQTVFGWETATASGDTTTETVDGIMLTLTNDNVGAGMTIPTNWGGWMGTTDNVVNSGSTTSVTFTFDQPVDVNSILPLEANTASKDYTFTPTGGSNSPVVVSLVGGAAPGGDVNLNWTNITSFTVTAPSLSNMAFDNLSVSAISPPPTTIFGWETATASGDTTTETVDGIMLTLTNDNVGAGMTIPTNWGGWMGTTDNVVNSGSTTSVTFTFDQPVDINSILPLEANTASKDYTFTPTGGSNSPVVVSLVGGAAPGGDVNLNWTNITSFTVTAPSLSNMAFDNLSVSLVTLSVIESNVQSVKVFPNPVENILYIKNVSDLKFIDVYNNLGQLVLQSETNTIGVSHLSKGMYFLQIHTSQGIETKRIIKK